MATNVMKSADLIILASNQKDRIPGKIKRLIGARLVELGYVRKIDPGLYLFVSCIKINRI
jgi:hypothetical protein